MNLQPCNQHCADNNGCSKCIDEDSTAIQYRLSDLTTEYKEQLALTIDCDNRQTAMFKLAYLAGIRDSIGAMYEKSEDFIESEVGEDFHRARLHVGGLMSKEEQRTFCAATYYTFPQLEE